MSKKRAIQGTMLCMAPLALLLLFLAACAPLQTSQMSLQSSAPAPSAETPQQPHLIIPNPPNQTPAQATPADVQQRIIIEDEEGLFYVDKYTLIPLQQETYVPRLTKREGFLTVEDFKEGLLDVTPEYFKTLDPARLQFDKSEDVCLKGKNAAQCMYYHYALSELAEKQVLGRLRVCTVKETCQVLCHKGRCMECMPWTERPGGILFQGSLNKCVGNEVHRCINGTWLSAIACPRGCIEDVAEKRKGKTIMEGHCMCDFGDPNLCVDKFEYKCLGHLKGKKYYTRVGKCGRAAGRLETPQQECAKDVCRAGRTWKCRGGYLIRTDAKCDYGRGI